MRLKKWLYYALFAVLLAALFGCASVEKTTEKPVVEPEKKAEEPQTEVVLIPVITAKISYIGTDILESETVYTYEDEKLTTIETSDSYGDPLETIRLSYNAQENPAEKTRYDEDNKLRSLWRYEYDERGNRTREEVYNRNEKLQTISEYMYDTNGNRIRWNVMEPGGSLMAYTVYEYDDGYNTRINTYAADERLRDYFIRSFENGVLILEERFDEDGDLLGSVEYEYVKGLMTREVHHRANGSVERSIEYEYDDNESVVTEIYKRADGTVEQLIENSYRYREEERIIRE